jgi:DNA-binding transcriptional MerR regulator
MSSTAPKLTTLLPLDTDKIKSKKKTVQKSDSAYKTIGEVADFIDVPQHVLRFWEEKFSALKPVKRAGGRRYYRPEDTAILIKIKALLYQEGYTIKGVQRLIQKCRKEKLPVLDGLGNAFATTIVQPSYDSITNPAEIKEIIEELDKLKLYLYSK